MTIPRNPTEMSAADESPLFVAQRTELPAGRIPPPRVDTARNGMTYHSSPPSHEPTRLWTTQDLAKFLGCSERQIPRLRDEGMPVLMIGALVRFSPNRVMEWLESRQTPAP